MKRARPRGVVLLEVMAALAILGVAGLTLVTLASENSAAIERVARADTENRRASDFLAVVSLWSASQLDARLGAHRQGPWMLEIQREAPGLYSVAVLDSLRRRRLLETTFYKQEARR